MVTEKVKFVWDSPYLDDRSIDEFVELDLKSQSEIIRFSFSNFIKFGLNASPVDEQQAEFVFNADDAIATGEKPQISVRSGHGTGKQLFFHG